MLALFLFKYFLSQEYFHTPDTTIPRLLPSEGLY